MSKQWWIIGGIVILLGAATGGLFWYKGERILPLAQLKTTFLEGESSILGETVVYEDEAGFSFEYPKTLTVEDITPVDQLHYSVLEITGNNGGKATIIVRDTDSQTADEWLRDDQSAPKLAQVAGATSLSGVAAKQYTYSRGAQKLLITVAIDKGILYLIESPKDSDFWEEVETRIVDTFAIGQRSDLSDAPQEEDENVIYEEEEIVE